jgi:hypothetical protein
VLAITAYHNQTEVLVCDDASQFHLVTLWLALCWVHVGRSFKKLNPLVRHHQQILETFLKQF